MPKSVEIPDLSDKHIIVTGSNTGIGKVTALELAKAGASVVLACRSESKALPVVDEIRQEAGHDRVEFQALDLGDFDSVRAFVDSYQSSGQPIDILINNAGLAGAQGVTKEGFEVHFGVNHLGPFLLTLGLIENVLKAPNSRIVNVASRAHTRVKKWDLEVVQQRTPSKSGFPEYCVSKLANVFFNMELAKRLSGTGTSTYALHPGVVASDIWRRVPFPFRNIAMLFMITNEEGAQTTLHCAVSEAAGRENGLYYDKCKPVATAKLGQDEALAKDLWERSLEWTGATDFKPA